MNNRIKIKMYVVSVLKEGINKFFPKIKIRHKLSDNIALIVRQLFMILLAFSLLFGKNRIKLTLKPRSENIEIRFMDEIKTEAIPTSKGE